MVICFKSSSGPIVCLQQERGIVFAYTEYITAEQQNTESQKQRDIVHCSQQCQPAVIRKLFKKYQFRRQSQRLKATHRLICQLQTCTVYSGFVYTQTKSYMDRHPDTEQITMVFFSFSRLAQYMWETSHSSCCWVTYCERRASRATLLALASVHAGEKLH